MRRINYMGPHELIYIIIAHGFIYLNFFFSKISFLFFFFFYCTPVVL